MRVRVQPTLASDVTQRHGHGVLMVSCWDLGWQPLAVVAPAGWLRARDALLARTRVIHVNSTIDMLNNYTNVINDVRATIPTLMYCTNWVSELPCTLWVALR